MGRWGHRVFEGDRDIDLAVKISAAFGDEPDDNLHLSRMIHQTDMLASPERRAYYKTAEYRIVLDAIVADTRAKLDGNQLCDRLFDYWRARERDCESEYRVIVLGALMMRAGAKIRKEDFEHLRELVPRVACFEKFTMPFLDKGFRGPGKKQFLAALDNYQPGVPRSFQEPSCFQCGKIKADIGKAMMKCSRCLGAWYCDKDCQKQHWTSHKTSCKDPKTVFLLNV